ncbi:Resolvase, N terminal domain [Rhizobium sp. RU36D]|nr:Resolvase, N terminal domain [Rhizobium sp. RU36D]
MGMCFVLRLRRIWGRAAGQKIALTVGYARISTKKQNLAVQLHALKNADCDTIYADRATGASPMRRGLAAAMRKVRPQDQFVIWRLDRLSRKATHLVTAVENLTERGVQVRVLTGRGTFADFSNPEGRFVLGIIASFVQLEYETIGGRTAQGLRLRLESGRTSSPQRAKASGWLKRHFRLAIERTSVRPWSGVGGEGNLRA